MVSSKIINKSLLEQEAHERPYYRRLGLLNGLFIGVALVSGAWIGQVFSLAQLPIRLQYPGLILGSVLLVGLCALAGWLTSRWAKIALTFLVWLGTAVAITFIFVYLPSHGRNLVVWLIDSRFAGLPVYPPISGPWFILLITGFAIFLVLMVLAILQSYRLEGAQRELSADGRLSRRSLFMLLWPMIFVAFAGYITNDIVGDRSAQDALLVQEAIDTGRTYEGDLFALGLERGVNYSAIQGVRDQMSENYTLLIGGIDADAATTFVVAEFDNGAWVTCRIISGQLSFCYDSAPPYTLGLATLISGEPVPEDCRGCNLQADVEWQQWLQDRHGRLGNDPNITRVSQWGSYVLMRAESASGDFAVECLFDSISPVILDSCREI